MSAPQQAGGKARSKATATSSSAVPADKPKKDGHARQPQNPPNASVKLKVVVRGLPPNLPEAVFKNATKEWINDNTVDWYYYVGGKLYERGNKPNVRSRAYAKFKSQDLLVTFHKAFNGHTFTDSKGRSSRAMIEFAPFQKSVKGKVKQDSRQGTIDSSPEYKEFLESLSQPTPSEAIVATAEEEPTTTPLIEYLRTQKATKAERERINKEKARLAKLAAVQAKANAQTAKLRAEKLQKAESAASKPPETSRDGKSPSVRSGRGGKSAARGRDTQRSKGQQHHQVLKKNATPSTGEEPSNEAPAVQVSSPTSPAVPPTIIASATPDATNDSGSSSQVFRGGRGRGRGRAHGAYRSGGGRGGKRGGSGPDTRPSTSVAEG